ncbi:sensor histidine kinase [Stieleria sp.]|uniref:sensor histidine kinase n=1 Tax=Stieleria sp. TaxID=2795976 RepID=UPI003569CC97
MSRIADLMATPRDQAIQRRPIRIRGTVSLIGDGITSAPRKVKASQSFCVEDSTAGIWVRSGHAIREGVLLGSDRVLPELDYGVDVELDGYLDRGAFAPVILPTRITILGTSKLPAASRAFNTRFLNGADELRRVTVNGVVQNISTESSNWWSLRVETGVGHFVTRVPKDEPYSPSRLLDAEVDLTGIAAVCWNWRSEFVCPRLIIAHREDIRILQPASDPFAAERVSIENLDGYTPSGRPRHRRRIEGTVTYYDGDLLLYVQENGIGIQVRLNDPLSIELGDRVEVSGFIDTSRYLAGLRGAVVRRIGRRDDPVAVPLTISQIIEDHQGFSQGQPTTPRSCDGQLIQLTGRLLDFQVGSATEQHRLQIDCGDSVTTAFLSGDMRPLTPGTELKATGIAKLVFSAPVATASLAKPDRVDLLLRDHNDLLILSTPSWWTPRRTFNALLVLAGFALSASVWAFTMRRTLAQRTDQLAREMRNRRDVALEFQAAIQERTRLAANLHDTLLQTLAGIAYQLEACGQPGTKPFRDHLETASRMIQHGQEDLRNTVWALHCLPQTEGSFVDSVKQMTRRLVQGHDTTINIQSAESFPVLADFIAGNLLLVIQEAVHNAIKHARAERIEVELSGSPDQDHVSVIVRDHGIGFDLNTRKTSSDGHFGMEGMEQRIERLGGTLAIESQRGVGTTIHADIPLREFDPKIA